MKNTSSGFTLIETMVAISLLMLALIAPMSLAAESLTAAYYSRSQITAFYLAQEGIEVVRSVRDANILAVAEGGTVSSVFNGIPQGTTLANAPAFTVDALQASNNALYTCAAGGCPPLMTNGSLYGYDDNGSAIGPDCPYSGTTWGATVCTNGNGWTNTTFTRTIKAYLVSATNPRELRVSVTVRWVQGSLQSQAFTINEDLYAWIAGS
jgi:hypothetical protein